MATKKVRKPDTPTVRKAKKKGGRKGGLISKREAGPRCPTCGLFLSVQSPGVYACSYCAKPQEPGRTRHNRKARMVRVGAGHTTKLT